MPERFNLVQPSGTARPRVAGASLSNILSRSLLSAPLSPATPALFVINSPALPGLLAFICHQAAALRLFVVNALPLCGSL